jgi:hypothetical protein
MEIQHPAEYASLFRPMPGCNIGVNVLQNTFKLFSLAAARCLLYDPA